ncbi:MAG: hypothetical protein ABIE43_03410 [Patescibacteria group bacterium]
MKKLFFTKLITLITIGFILSSQYASAYEISISNNSPIEDDVLLSPSKVELFLEPGESTIRNLNLVNRTQEKLSFEIIVEDFSGDDVASTKLLGDKIGNYSLKNYLKPEIKEFSLNSKEKITLPINIDIPVEAEPGGLYGAVIAQVKLADNDYDNNKLDSHDQINIISRLALLFFVRIEGDLHEEGYLKSFHSNKKIFKEGKVEFSIFFENKGNVHLNPYGKIDIKNIFGKKIEEINIEPWFVMPGFIRKSIVNLDKELIPGYYRAEISLYRGYGIDIIDKLSIGFWIMPWRILIMILFSIAIILLFFWLKKRFKINRRKLIKK